VAKITEVIEVPAGTVLARRAIPATSLPHHGRFRRTSSCPRGGATRLKPGDYFGEDEPPRRRARSATVVADTPMRLLVIKRRISRRCCARRPS